MNSLADNRHEQRFNRAFGVLLGFLFLLAPLYYQDNLGGEGLFLPFNNPVWDGVCFIVALGLLKILHSHRVALPALGGAMLIFLVATTLIGLVNSVSTPISWLFRSLAVWGGVLLFFACAQFRFSRRGRDLLLYLILLGTLVQSVYGLLQISIDPPLRWLPISAGIPRGIFQQQNLEASYVATGLIAALLLLTQPGFRHERLLLKGLLFVATGLNALIIVTSGSRVGLLGAAVGLLLVALCRFRPLLRRRRAATLFLVVLLGGGGGGYFVDSRTGGLEQSLEKLDALTSSTADPTQSDVRWMIYGSSWELFKQHPLLGYGIGRFQRVWHDEKPRYLQSHPDAAVLTKRLSHPHNEILYWALEGGLIALLGIAVLIGAFLRQLARLGWQRGGGYLALLLPIALHTQVELPFYISQLHWVLFVVLIALVASHWRRLRPVRLSVMARATGLALVVALPVLATIFFSHSLIAGRNLTYFTFSPKKDLKQLDLASHNLYFNGQAEVLRMQTLVQYALRHHDEALLTRYIAWAREKLKVIPDAGVYQGLAYALHETGQIDASHRVLLEGLAIYPTSDNMLIAARVIRARDQAKHLSSDWIQQMSDRVPLSKQVN